MYCHTNITTGSFRGVCTARTLILAASASRRRVFVLHVVFFFFFLTKETSAPPFWWRGAAEKKDMDFYGRDMAINNDLGIKLMSYLYLADADLTIVDYYDDDIYDYMDTLGSDKYILTRRTNNKKFIDFLMRL
jgi:hypothetical protein